LQRFSEQAPLEIAARVQNGYVSGHLHTWLRGSGRGEDLNICRDFEGPYLGDAFDGESRTCPRVPAFPGHAFVPLR
jgi:hypothetical protein